MNSMLFSASTGGFYTVEIHGKNVPSDVVEITTEEHSTLIEGQSTGKVITPDENGYPVLVEPVITPEQLQQQTNAAARQYLASTDWIVRRHNDELDMGDTTTLTSEEYLQLLMERKQKRLLVVEI